MPALTARAASSSPSPSTINIILIVALSVAALLLVSVIVAFVLPLCKSRRAARKQSPPPVTTLDEFMSKAQREHIREKAYATHRQNRSVGEDTPLVVDDVRQHLLPLESISRGEGPSSRELLPGLRIVVPAAKTTKQSSPGSPQSGMSSDSEYSQRSAGTIAARNRERMQTIDLASPPPPVPALPAHLKPKPQPLPLISSRKSEVLLSEPMTSPQTLTLDDTLYLGLRSELPPETPPLVRGDTVTVAGLLKSRARRLDNGNESSIHRSQTRTSYIERTGSIKEAPSPTDSPDSPRARRVSHWRLQLPVHSASVDSDTSGFGESLGSYGNRSTSPTSSLETVVPAASM
ncbi:hypothetical protein C8F01DRAFT_1134088 [Mycena amicta]|nr:hypothetical protein C8F01DRAFT_1134088 [Mycena amicta]